MGIMNQKQIKNILRSFQTGSETSRERRLRDARHYPTHAGAIRRRKTRTSVGSLTIIVVGHYNTTSITIYYIIWKIVFDRNECIKIIIRIFASVRANYAL